mmetsp:Transcript_113938/g.226705  ORF Transcript_113938/g.226705 Transcript_113938/m.226705 type:complete len:740 (-) Transcript_113938:36-2255(-)
MHATYLTQAGGTTRLLPSVPQQQQQQPHQHQHQHQHEHQHRQSVVARPHAALGQQQTATETAPTNWRRPPLGKTQVTQQKSQTSSQTAVVQSIASKASKQNQSVANSGSVMMPPSHGSSYATSAAYGSSYRVPATHGSSYVVPAARGSFASPSAGASFATTAAGSVYVTTMAEMKGASNSYSPPPREASTHAASNSYIPPPPADLQANNQSYIPPPAKADIPPPVGAPAMTSSCVMPPSLELKDMVAKPCDTMSEAPTVCSSFDEAMRQMREEFEAKIATLNEEKYQQRLRAISAEMRLQAFQTTNSAPPPAEDGQDCHDGAVVHERSARIGALGANHFAVDNLMTAASTLAEQPQPHDGGTSTPSFPPGPLGKNVEKPAKASDAGKDGDGLVSAMPCFWEAISIEGIYSLEQNAPSCNRTPGRGQHSYSPGTGHRSRSQGCESNSKKAETILECSRGKATEQALLAPLHLPSRQNSQLPPQNGDNLEVGVEHHAADPCKNIPRGTCKEAKFNDEVKAVDPEHLARSHSPSPVRVIPRAMLGRRPPAKQDALAQGSLIPSPSRAPSPLRRGQKIGLASRSRSPQFKEGTQGRTPSPTRIAGKCPSGSRLPTSEEQPHAVGLAAASLIAPSVEPRSRSAVSQSRAHSEASRTTKEVVVVQGICGGESTLQAIRRTAMSACRARWGSCSPNGTDTPWDDMNETCGVPQNILGKAQSFTCNANRKPACGGRAASVARRNKHL